MRDRAVRTVRDLVQWGAAEFRRARLHFGHGTDNAPDEAFHLVTWALGLPHDLPPHAADGVVTPAQRRRVLALLRKRIRTRKPAAYLTGEAWFAGRPYIVDERVLIPRSPIAEMIGERFRPWLRERPRRILDLCAGSGCIGIACAHEFPGAAVDAAELDRGALAVLRRNIARHRVTRRVHAVQSDLFAALRGRAYDLIACNPPYVAAGRLRKFPAEYHHEPRAALAGGSSGLELVDRILRQAPAHLTPRGVLVCEVGGTMPAFLRRYRDLPAIWPEFERGGDGVFVITRDELLSWNENHVR